MKKIMIILCVFCLHSFAQSKGGSSGSSSGSKGGGSSSGGSSGSMGGSTGSSGGKGGGTSSSGSSGSALEITFPSDSNLAKVTFKGPFAGQVPSTPDGCQYISCSNCPTDLSILIPLKTKAEWDAFKQNLPYDASFSECSEGVYDYRYVESSLYPSCYGGCLKAKVAKCVDIRNLSQVDQSLCGKRPLPSPSVVLSGSSSCGVMGNIESSDACAGKSQSGYKCDSKTRTLSNNSSLGGYSVAKGTLRTVLGSAYGSVNHYIDNDSSATTVTCN